MILNIGARIENAAREINKQYEKYLAYVSKENRKEASCKEGRRSTR